MSKNDEWYENSSEKWQYVHIHYKTPLHVKLSEFIVFLVQVSFSCTVKQKNILH